jgi:hypothetical protein
MRLMEGANIYQIACTSVGLIEKYYGVHIENSLNGAALNVARSGKDVTAKKKYELSRNPPQLVGRSICPRLNLVLTGGPEQSN